MLFIKYINKILWIKSTIFATEIKLINHANTTDELKKIKQQAD